MIILSDTDVVRKLACCDLLLEFLQLLKCPPNDMWVLPSLRFQIKRWFAGSPETLRAAELFLSKVRVVPLARTETLERLRALDVGEQQLLALLCDEPRVRSLVTGDKRALRQVAGLSFQDESLRSRLGETSVYCFEAILLGLVGKRGFAAIQARIQNKWAKRSGEQVDAVALAAFPLGGTEAVARRVLSERLMDLKASLPPIQFDEF